jgi:hypothetical protein
MLHRLKNARKYLETLFVNRIQMGLRAVKEYRRATIVQLRITESSIFLQN